MKKVFLTSAVAVILAVIMTLGVLSVAQADSSTMDDAHASRIRANCVTAQSTLNRVHASDALLRVNRGQLYELISTKLMATLNSRIALNRLDGSKLSQIAALYEQNLDTFRTTYQAYEEQLSSTLKIDCTKQPVTFYDSVNNTRTKRMAVHASITELNKQITDYSTVFNEFNAAYTAASKGVSAQ